MSHDDIKKIYEILLERWSSGRYRIAYNNVKFTPKGNETYIKSNILPSVTRSLALSGDHTMYSGMYQITVVCPLNTSTKICNDIYKELKDVFVINERNTLDDVEYVQQISPIHTTQGFVKDTTFIYPMWFEYRSDVN